MIELAPYEVPCVPLVLRLTPADGSFCSNSPTDPAPEFFRSCSVIVVTTPTPSASLRWMREPTTMISSTASAAWAAGAVAVCARAGVAKAPASRAA